MLSNIKELFGDLDFFSKQVAEVDLSTIMFEQYDFSKGYMAIDTIFTKCDQFLNIKEAFAAIFCKELHDIHEWDISTQPSPDDLQWIKAIRKIWITENYLKFEGIQLEFVDVNNFIKKVAQPKNQCLTFRSVGGDDYIQSEYQPCNGCGFV